jgi:hypothetical protein
VPQKKDPVELDKNWLSMLIMVVGISWMRRQTDMETVSKSTTDGASQQPEEKAIYRELGERYYLFALLYYSAQRISSERVETAWTGALSLRHPRGRESHRNEKRILRIPKQLWV